MATTVSTSGSTPSSARGAPPPEPGTVTVRSAFIRRRSRTGITGMTFASARTDGSANPATPVEAAADSPTASATASSSSSTSGGSDAPGAGAYPPSTPRCAWTG